MNATEAHKLAAASLQGPVIEPQLNFVLQRIEEASRKGRFELNHPFNGWNVSAWPSEGEKKAVWQALRALGYEVEHMPDPDPGHPASSPYDRIRW
jgi:hypothetical protein